MNYKVLVKDNVRIKDRFSFFQKKGGGRSIAVQAAQLRVLW